VCGWGIVEPRITHRVIIVWYISVEKECGDAESYTKEYRKFFVLTAGLKLHGKRLY